MKYERLKFHLAGVSALLMHNGRLADPLEPIARQMRQVSAKRKKTEADHEELGRLEFLGGLYLDDGEPCIPGELIEAAFVNAAKKMRRGAEAKIGIIADANFKLIYDGPRDPQKLWADKRFRFRCGVRIKNSRIIRTRPIFRDWACEIFVDFQPNQLNRADVDEMAKTAGAIVGIGDGRPKFGRFAVATI
jgi:hypothetical protein